MNYLSHHALARAAWPDAPPAFYTGNVLPDLLAASGDGRLRAHHVAAPPGNVDADLVTGVRLHHAADQRFHAHPAFRAATARASEALKAAAFPTPPRRVFFLAHVLVEIALDGWLLMHTGASVADDFYAQLNAADLPRVAADTQRLLGAERPLLDFAGLLEHFMRARWLYDYATPEGRATRLVGLSRRAGVEGFAPTPRDRETLAAVFANFAPTLAADTAALLVPPARALWYNTGEN